MQSVRSCALGDVGRVLLTLIGGIRNWVVVGVGGFGDGLEVRRIGGCNWWCQLGRGGSGSMSERFNTGSLCSGFKAIWSI